MMFIQVEMNLNCHQSIISRIVEEIVLAKVDVVAHVKANVQDVNVPVLLIVQEVTAWGSVLVHVDTISRMKGLIW